MKQERPHRIRLIYHLVRSERYAEALRAMEGDPNKNSTSEYVPYIDVLLRRLRKDDKAVMRLLVTKSTILFNRGKIEESEMVLKRIMRLAVLKKNDNLMGYAYHQICAYSAMTYAFQKAVFTGWKALYYYGRSDVKAESVQNVLGTMALAQVQRGDIEEARRLIVQDEAVRGGDPFEAAEARVQFHLLSGDYGKALGVLSQSLASLPDERTVSRFFAYDLKVKVLWQLCDFESIRATSKSLLELGPLSEPSLAQVNAMFALSSFFCGEKEEAKNRFMQAEFYLSQVGNDFDRLDALRTLALCRYLSGEVKKAEETAIEALTIGLRYSCYWPTFMVLMLLVESSMDRCKEERARFFLNEASYFFTTGFLLPSKDLILYYYFASKLFDPKDADRYMTVAARLLEEEKSRLGDPELVSNFLSIRSFGKIQREIDGLKTASVADSACIEEESKE